LQPRMGIMCGDQALSPGSCCSRSRSYRLGRASCLP